jgi:hypothetical protein
MADACERPEKLALNKAYKAGDIVSMERLVLK